LTSFKSTIPYFNDTDSASTVLALGNRAPSGNSLSGAFGKPAIQAALIDAELPRNHPAEWSEESACLCPEGIEPLPDLALAGQAKGAGDSWAGPKGGWPSLGAHSIPQRSNRIHEYVIESESLLFDPRTKNLYYLNETAHAVWRLCDGRNISAVASGMAGLYGVDVGVLQGHVLEFVGLLVMGELLALETTDSDAT